VREVGVLVDGTELHAGPRERVDISMQSDNVATTAERQRIARANAVYEARMAARDEM